MPRAQPWERWSRLTLTVLTFTYSILSNPGNHFAISGDLLKLVSTDSLNTLSKEQLSECGIRHSDPGNRQRLTAANVGRDDSILRRHQFNDADPLNGVLGDDVIYGFNKSDVIVGQAGTFAPSISQNDDGVGRAETHT